MKLGLKWCHRGVVLSVDDAAHCTVLCSLLSADVRSGTSALSAGLASAAVVIPLSALQFHGTLASSFRHCVRAAQWLGPGSIAQSVAVKCRLHCANDTDVTTELMRGIALQHPQLVKIVGVCKNGQVR